MFRKAKIKLGVGGLAVLALCMVVFIGAGPPEPVQQAVYGSKWAVSDGVTRTHICLGGSSASRQLDEIVGRSEMSCNPPYTLQSMSAELRKCRWWGGLFCIRAKTQQHLDSGSKSGSGYWELPDYGFYRSDPLSNGRYRVRTRHTATGGGESYSGWSKTGWIRVH